MSEFFWNWLAMIWFDLFNNEQSPFPRKKSIEFIPSRYKPWELNVMQVYYGYQKSTNDCDDLFGLYTREQSIKKVPISEFPSDQHSRKKGLTYRVRVRIVTTTQNGTKHKELGLSTAVESPQPGTGSSRLGSYQSRDGTGKSIDREYKTKWIKACRAN